MIFDDTFDTENAVWQSPTKSVTDKDDNSDSGTGKKVQKRRTTECFELSNKYLYRRAFGEDMLLQKLGVDDFKIGHSYHCITGGNVDSLSFLKVILLHQNIDWLMCSTWCMAAEDIKQFEFWIDEGKIKKLDFYVGEIFPTSYVIEWRMLNDLFKRKNCGRIAAFKNHSKIYAGYGEKFPFVIESSANINTNPRTEQCVITIDGGLVEFYKNYFDKIKSYE